MYKYSSLSLLSSLPISSQHHPNLQSSCLNQLHLTSKLPAFSMCVQRSLTQIPTISQLRNPTTCEISNQSTNSRAQLAPSQTQHHVFAIPGQSLSSPSDGRNTNERGNNTDLICQSQTSSNPDLQAEESTPARAFFANVGRAGYPAANAGPKVQPWQAEWKGPQQPKDGRLIVACAKNAVYGT